LQQPESHISAANIQTIDIDVQHIIIIIIIILIIIIESEKSTNN